jgi:hypothetical protein
LIPNHSRRKSEFLRDRRPSKMAVERDVSRRRDSLPCAAEAIAPLTQHPRRRVRTGSSACVERRSRSWVSAAASRETSARGCPGSLPPDGPPRSTSDALRGKSYSPDGYKTNDRSVGPTYACSFRASAPRRAMELAIRPAGMPWLRTEQLPGSSGDLRPSRVFACHPAGVVVLGKLACRELRWRLVTRRDSAVLELGTQACKKRSGVPCPYRR